MASEVSQESQDEKAALVEADPEQDAHRGTVAKRSKLTLYHWTQSFNSQKVSPASLLLQHHSSVDSSPSQVQLEISEMDLLLLLMVLLWKL